MFLLDFLCWVCCCCGRSWGWGSCYWCVGRWCWCVWGCVLCVCRLFCFVWRGWSFVLVGSLFDVLGMSVWSRWSWRGWVWVWWCDFCLGWWVMCWVGFVVVVVDSCWWSVFVIWWIDVERCVLLFGGFWVCRRCLRVFVCCFWVWGSDCLVSVLDWFLRCVFLCFLVVVYCVVVWGSLRRRRWWCWVCCVWCWLSWWSVVCCRCCWERGWVWWCVVWGCVWLLFSFFLWWVVGLDWRERFFWCCGCLSRLRRWCWFLGKWI